MKMMWFTLCRLGVGLGATVGVGVGPGLAPTPWQPVRTARDSSATKQKRETLRNRIIFFAYLRKVLSACTQERDFPSSSLRSLSQMFESGPMLAAAGFT